VVTCRYLLDLDEAESAAVLGWPRGTVKSRLHRAMARLRDLLEAEVDRPETSEAMHDG
jgi:RNA polymerase sigma-70 factor (ECF subfamily)